MDEFTCAMCGFRGPKGWSDAEAEAEFAEQFGHAPPGPRVLLCDDCYQQMTALYPPKLWSPPEQ